MSKVTVECQLTYTTEIDEEDVETFFSGFHTITEIPEDVILDEAWIYEKDGNPDGINGNDLIDLEGTN